MSGIGILGAALAAQATANGAAPASIQTPSDRQSGQSTYLDIEAGAGYATNPVLTLGSNSGRAFGRLSLHGVHTRVTDRTTTLLSAYAENLTYTSRYGSQQSLAVDARHDIAVNERLTVFGDARASIDKGGQLDTRIISVPTVPALPGSPEIPPVLLPGGTDFLSVTGRAYNFAAHVGGTLSLSPRESLSFSSGIQRVTFHGSGASSNYTTVPLLLGYNRQISPTTTVGGRIVAEISDYDGPGSVRTISPQFTFGTRFSERMSFNGAVGVSFTRIDDGVRTRHSTGLSGNLSLCRIGEFDQFCARAGIDQSTATTAGPAKSMNVGVDYSRKLDADSTIQFSLGAERYSSPISLVPGQTFSRTTYFRAAAAYTRRISNRWYGGVNVAARKLSRAGVDPDADLSASLFIRYRFGDVQ